MWSVIRPFRWSLLLDVDAALELVRARPATCPLLLVRPDGPRAGDTADRAVPRVVERVVRDLVDGDVRPDPLLVPVGERVELPDPVLLGANHLRRARAAGGLVATDARDPRLVGLQRLEQRLDLAHVAAAVRVALPEVGAL